MRPTVLPSFIEEALAQPYLENYYDPKVNYGSFHPPPLLLRRGGPRKPLPRELLWSPGKLCVLPSFIEEALAQPYLENYYDPKVYYGSPPPLPLRRGGPRTHLPREILWSPGKLGDSRILQPRELWGILCAPPIIRHGWNIKHVLMSTMFINCLKL